MRSNRHTWNRCDAVIFLDQQTRAFSQLFAFICPSLIVFDDKKFDDCINIHIFIQNNSKQTEARQFSFLLLPPQSIPCINSSMNNVYRIFCIFSWNIEYLFSVKKFVLSTVNGRPWSPMIAHDINGLFEFNNFGNQTPDLRWKNEKTCFITTNLNKIKWWRVKVTNPWSL